MTVFYFNVFYNVIYSCEAKLNFQQPLLQSSVSNDPSEIILMCWFGNQKAYIFININVKNSCAA